jgi:hypothetical membrane protein
MRRWILVSALLAPVAMIGGWTAAAAVQPGGYSSLRQTISALAGYGAQDRWIMTAGLALLGLCHVVTASGLTSARPAGRVLLALGGLATATVSTLPLPVNGPATAHSVTAGIGFVALALWPLFAARSGDVVVSAAASVVMLGLLAAFIGQLGGSAYIGLGERLLAGAESLWPAIVVSVMAHGRSNRAQTHLPSP